MMLPQFQLPQLQQLKLWQHHKLPLLLQAWQLRQPQPVD